MTQKEKYGFIAELTTDIEVLDGKDNRLTDTYDNIIV